MGRSGNCPAVWPTNQGTDSEHGCQPIRARGELQKRGAYLRAYPCLMFCCCFICGYTALLRIQCSANKESAPHLWPPRDLGRDLSIFRTTIFRHFSSSSECISFLSQSVGLGSVALRQRIQRRSAGARPLTLSFADYKPTRFSKTLTTDKI
jgi:hypothetical protein